MRERRFILVMISSPFDEYRINFIFELDLLRHTIAHVTAACFNTLSLLFIYYNFIRCRIILAHSSPLAPWMPQHEQTVPHFYPYFQKCRTCARPLHHTWLIEDHPRSHGDHRIRRGHRIEALMALQQFYDRSCPRTGLAGSRTKWSRARGTKTEDIHWSPGVGRGEYPFEGRDFNTGTRPSNASPLLLTLMLATAGLRKRYIPTEEYQSQHKLYITFSLIAIDNARCYFVSREVALGISTGVTPSSHPVRHPTRHGLFCHCVIIGTLFYIGNFQAQNPATSPPS
jgi:hypothetical protein